MEEQHHAEVEESGLTLFRFKMGAFLIIYITGMIGGLLPLKLRVKGRLLSLGNILSGGVFLSAGFCHMLAESVEQFDALEIRMGRIPLPYVLCMCGLLLPLFLERVAFQHSHHHHSIPVGDSNHEHSRTEEAAQSEEEGSNSRGFVKIDAAKLLPINVYMLGIVLSFHSIVEGIALGIEPTQEGVNTILVAIIAHKIFDTFAFGINLAKQNLATKQIVQWVGLFSLSTPMGILLGLFALQSSPNSPLSAAVMALSAGTFMYIALVEVILEEFEHNRDKPLKFVLLCVGVMIMALFSHDESHEHSHGR